MNLSRSLTVLAVCLLLAPVALFAQVDEGAKDILKQSAEAIKNSNGLEMTTAKSATGMLKDMIDATATIKLLRNKDTREALFEVDGRRKQPGKGDEQVQVIFDGGNVTWIDHIKRELIERAETDSAARNQLNLLYGTVLPRIFLDAEPFSREMGLPKIERLGVEQVGGEVCDLIAVSPANSKMTETWAISAIDRLPRRLVQSAGEGAQKIDMIFEVKSLKPSPMTAKDFSLELPAGYARNLAPPPVVTPTNPNMPAAPVEVAKLGIAEGEPLPEINLTDSTGAAFNPGAVPHSATVLYFFGSVFKPSTNGLDDMQALHDQYKDRGVEFVALACREPSDTSAKELFERRQLSMRLIPKAESVMEPLKVMGFPSCYVLGPDGNVITFFQGPATRQQLAQSIDQALAGK